MPSVGKNSARPGPPILRCMRAEDEVQVFRGTLWWRMDVFHVARRDSSAWRAQIVAACVGAGIVRTSIVLP
jgi:hypothetical protein